MIIGSATTVMMTLTKTITIISEIASNRSNDFPLQPNEVGIAISPVIHVSTSWMLETPEETGSTGSILRVMETLYQFTVT